MPTLYGAENQAEILLPFPMQPDAAQDRDHEDYNILGKLKPGVTVAQAQAEMNTLTARLRQDHPNGISAQWRPHLRNCAAAGTSRRRRPPHLDNFARRRRVRSLDRMRQRRESLLSAPSLAAKKLPCARPWAPVLAASFASCSRKVSCSRFVEARSELFSRFSASTGFTCSARKASRA